MLSLKNVKSPDSNFVNFPKVGAYGVKPSTIKRVWDTSQQAKFQQAPQGGKWEFYGIGYSIPMLAILPPITYYAWKTQTGNLKEKFMNIVNFRCPAIPINKLNCHSLQKILV